MRRNNRWLARGILKLICTFLGIILAGMTCLTLYVQALTGQLPPAVQPVFSAVENVANHSFRTGTGVNSAKSINLLLVGQDHREGETGNRSDSIILCTFNPDTEELVMTSFLRDLYLPIPGHGSNRLNAAYSFGGTRLLKQTLINNFSADIDGCVEVDFTQFSRIIDLLGGVELELRPDETAVINEETGSTLQPGLQLLNGDQALAYSRIRKLDMDGDFSRTARQRKVLESVWDNYKESSLPKLVRTIGNLIPIIETDLNSGELLSYAVTIFPHLENISIRSQTIPAPGHYSDRVIDGMSVLVADMNTARETIQNTQFSQFRSPEK